MIERPILKGLHRLEVYLHRDDTFFAETLDKISPKVGPDYRNSWQKIIFDDTMALPPAVFSILAIPFLAAFIKIEDQFRPKEQRGPVFYIHERLNHQGQEINVVKLRSLIPRSDQTPDNEGFAGQFQPEDDPRATVVGKFMRKFYLDELPQVWQVFSGRLALIAPRVKSMAAINKIRTELIDKERNCPEDNEKLEEDYNKWQEKRSKGPLGIVNSNAVISNCPKKDSVSRHADIFQADHAGLAFDLLLVSLLPIKILQRILRKRIKAKLKHHT